MKRILIFALSYYPKPVGGAEVAIKEITDRMDMDEYEFHLITNRFDSNVPKVEKVGNVTVHRIGITKRDAQPEDLTRLPLHLNKPLYQFTAYWYAKKLHKEKSFDGIWAMMAHGCGVPAARFKKHFLKCRTCSRFKREILLHTLSQK